VGEREQERATAEDALGGCIRASKCRSMHGPQLTTDAGDPGRRDLTGGNT
jgi:hypothetical protein